jgi:hypothetical protein
MMNLMSNPKVTVSVHVSRPLTEDELTRVHEAAIDALPVDATPSVSSAIVEDDASASYLNQEKTDG